MFRVKAFYPATFKEPGKPIGCILHSAEGEAEAERVNQGLRKAAHNARRGDVLYFVHKDKEAANQ